MTTIKAMLLTLVIGLTCSNVLSAQSLWLENSDRNSVQIEILKPKFEGSGPYRWNSSVIYATLQQQLTEVTTLVVELPFMNGGLIGDPSGNFASFGNPYIGFILSTKSEKISWSVGIRADSFKDYTFDIPLEQGIYGDFNRITSVAPNLISVDLRFNYNDQLSEFGFFQFQFGPSLIRPSRSFGDSFGENNSLQLSYALQVGRKVGTYGLLVGFTGQQFIGYGGVRYGSLYFQQSHALQFGGAFWLNFTRFQPGIQLHIPMTNELAKVLDYSVGVNVRYFI